MFVAIYIEKNWLSGVTSRLINEGAKNFPCAYKCCVSKKTTLITTPLNWLQ